MKKNMKIGILTFHRPVNYGAYLQSFALSKHLQKIFPKVNFEIVDYIAPKEKKNIYLNVLRTIKWYGIFAAIKEIKKIEIFKNELKYLNLSDKYFCSEDLEKLYSYIDNKYDALIIGSDAIFNWDQNGFPSAFIPNYKFKIPVVTYAASVHGLKYFDVDKEKIDKCGSAFMNMSFIGVRDKNTEKFVNYCNKSVNPIHCCDPTVIMDYEVLYSIKHRSMQDIANKYSIDLSKKYIVMMLEDQEIAKEIYEYYSQKYSIISLFKKNKYSDAFLYDLTPVEWALVLKNARLVITNYFHGTLLALGQNTPTVVVDLSNYNEPYEGKLDDLMCRRFELSELYVKQDQWYKKKNILFETMQECINGKFDLKISNSVKSEAKSFEKFYQFLNGIIYKN